jgi:hypothetical protein
MVQSALKILLSDSSASKREPGGEYSGVLDNSMKKGLHNILAGALYTRESRRLCDDEYASLS